MITNLDSLVKSFFALRIGRLGVAVSADGVPLVSSSVPIGEQLRGTSFLGTSYQLAISLQKMLIKNKCKSREGDEKISLNLKLFL